VESIASSARGWIVLVMLAGCGSSGDDEWTIDDPPRHAYTDETLPRMEVPEEESWSTASVPLEEMGQDTGEPGILYSAALMAYYQMRMLDADEGFHYEYDPTGDGFIESDSVHRKVVSTISLATLHELTRREDLRFSVERMLAFLRDQAVEQEDGTLELRDLGATSMFAIALSQHIESAGAVAWEETLERVAGHLMSLVNPDGSLQDGSPLFYAQAHLGLWKVYRATGDELWLDTLERVARFHYEHRDDDTYVDSAHLYGLWAHEPLTELYMIRPLEWIPEFVFDNADSVIDDQYTPLDDVDERLLGSFDESSEDRTWRAILKLEGTIDAYRLAVLVGDEERAERYRKSALLAVQFIQGLQYRRGDTGGFPDPARSVGGVPYGFDSPIVRIEVPGHAVVALCKVVQYMDLEDYPARP
jgi:hypothetical protein